MIIYKCDRCPAEPTPDKLYDVEVIFTPRGLDGGEDVDKEDRHWIGQVCAACADVLELQAKALVKERVPRSEEGRAGMAKRGDVKLGDEAKDTITGLKGVVIAITDWLAGCQRISIQPRELKDGKPVEHSTFDVEQIEVLTSGSGAVKEAGGPHDAPTRHADVRR